MFFVLKSEWTKRMMWIKNRTMIISHRKKRKKK